MDGFQHLELQKATEQWNTLALEIPSRVTIAFHPGLFKFYYSFLSLSYWYFILYFNDGPAGLFPVVKTGRSFTSMPYFSGGGILWLKKTRLHEQEIMLYIIEKLNNENLSSGFYRVNVPVGNQVGKSTARVEVRTLHPLFSGQETEKAMSMINLRQDEEKQFGLFDSNLRRKINKAAKNGIKIRRGKVGLLDDFSHVYNRNMHRIGSPSLGKKFFKAVLSSVNETMLLVAYLNDKPIGGSFLMWYDGYAENTWFSTLGKYNRLYTSYLLHWEAIRWAIQNGMHIYSMGRSTVGSGTHKYKLQWPVDVKPLYFNTNIEKKISLKDQRWATKVWKVLPPFLVDALGPAIAKRIY